LPEPPRNQADLQPVRVSGTSDTPRVLRVDLWKTALGELALQMPKSTFETWLAPTHLLAIDDGKAMIGVSNTMARDWFEHRLAGKISQTLEGLLGHTVEDLEFVVLSPEEK